jgi:hypothetical protein
VEGHGAGSGVLQRIEALCGVGVAIVVSTVDDSGVPAITRGWGPRLGAASGRLVVAVTAGSGSPTAHRLGVGRPISVTLSEMPTYATVQVKGEVAVVRPLTADERALADLHVDRFVDAAVRLGIAAGAERMFLGDLVTVEVVPHRVYEQTPGVTAGDLLAGSAGDVP